MELRRWCRRRRIVLLGSRLWSGSQTSEHVGTAGARSWSSIVLDVVWLSGCKRETLDVSTLASGCKAGGWNTDGVGVHVHVVGIEVRHSD